MYRISRAFASIALIGLLVLAPSAPTYAAHSLKITNLGRMNIEALYVSVSNEDEWGDDRLGNAKLGPGQTYTIRLVEGCHHDVRALYYDGAKRELHNIYTCGGGITEIAFHR